MKKTLVLVCLLIVALTLSACGGSKPTEFSSEAGGFSIMTPITLEEQTQPVDTAAGQIEMHLFMGDQGNTGYVIAYADYPPEIIAESDSQTLLEGVRDGAIGNVNGALVSEQAISINGYPGIEIVANVTNDGGEEGVLKAHVYIVNNRLYQVMIITQQGDTDTAEMDEFLQSFKLLEQ